MADSYTDFLNLVKPEVGGSRDAWGAKWNANADALSLWAKATDALAKDALPRTALNKDANGAEIPWSVAGAVSFAKNVTMAGNLGMAKGQRIAFSETQALETVNSDSTIASFDLVAPKSGVFRVVNNAYNAEILRVDATGKMTMGGATVWSSNNLTPANYASKVDAVPQIFAGPLLTNGTKVTIVYPSVRTWAALTGNDGRFYIQDVDTGNYNAIFGLDGGLFLRSFGDLNSRIETRAAAFADDRLATARNEYGQKVAKAGDTMTGNLQIAPLGNVDVQWQLVRAGVRSWRGVIDSNGNFSLQDISGNQYFSFRTDGGMNVPSFGDLSSRIETRAAAFADDRLATARAEYGQKVAKAGDTMIGDLTISKVTPRIFWNHPNVRQWAQTVDTDGVLSFTDNSGNNRCMYLHYNGGLWLSSFGDLNTRIETRAAAFADDRKAAAIAAANNITSRLTFIADRQFGEFGSNLMEPYTGAVVTGGTSNNNSGYATTLRFRQFQMRDVYGNFYSCSYA